MRMIGLFAGTLFLLLPALACDDEIGPSVDTFTATLMEGEEPHEQFHAPALAGSKEVPPVSSDASGAATFTLVGSTLSFELDVADIDSATAAHIHIGAEDESGGILVPLFEGPTTGLDFTGRLADGTVEIADSVAAHMLAGNTYVNVHTRENPPGEIRDQVALVSTGATGAAEFSLSENMLTFELSVADIDEVTAAHIHLGGEGVAGPVLVALFEGPTTAAGFSGVLAEGGVVIEDSVITHMRAGNTYVNVHTLANPMGAIRGQIRED